MSETPARYAPPNLIDAGRALCAEMRLIVEEATKITGDASTAAREQALIDAWDRAYADHTMPQLPLGDLSKVTLSVPSTALLTDVLGALATIGLKASYK
jgi:hypothetical protein